MTSTTVWVMTAAAAATALVCVAAAGAQQTPRTGEQIMNASCGTCHDDRRIQTSAMDQDGWTATVNAMIERGAVVPEAERPVLIDYLVRAHGPMPDGPGKEIVLYTCSICHDLTRIKRASHTPEEWQETLIAMLNEGAPLSDEDFPAVLLYLARNFGVR